MTEEQKDRVLADCLEDYHRERALGQRPDESAYRDRLGDLYDEFVELLLAETAIDEALESALEDGEDALPQNWGDYVLLGEIGRGAAGVVYEALHRELGRKVALKVLRTGMDTDQTARERFRREAQALAQVRHDNIVEIFEFGTKGDRLFYAMSLVDGPSLAELNKRDERPDPRTLCAGLAGVADALQALHEAGIVHRDVKPSNIMIAPDGRYLLADFGLARTELAETMTRTGDALGTPLYMSPEQMLGKRDAVEARTDVYGLGAALYQLLTGQPPFKTDNLHALMRMVLSQRPQPASTVEPSLPPGCGSIAMKCLEKEPGDRYDSAAALAEDLRAFAEGDRVSGRPLTPVERGLRVVKRRPLVSLASAAALVLIAVGAWSMFSPADPYSVDVNILEQEGIVEVAGISKPEPVTGLLLEPGQTYEMVVRPVEDGWLPYKKTLVAKAGQSLDFERRMFPPAGDGSEAINDEFRKRYGISTQHRAGKPRRQRDATQTAMLDIAFPRGQVRMEDLTEWRLFRNYHFLERYGDKPGWLVFERDGETLYRVECPPAEMYLTRGPFPTEVREKLKPGDVVRWGFLPPEGRRYKKDEQFQTFTVVDESVNAELQERFDRMDEDMRDWMPQTRKILGTTLRAEMMLDAGLALAAYREVLGVIRPDPEAGRDVRVSPDATLGLIELERLALRKLYPKRKYRDLATPWHEWQRHQGAFEQSDWDAFYAERASLEAAAAAGSDSGKPGK